MGEKLPKLKIARCHHLTKLPKLHFSYLKGKLSGRRCRVVENHILEYSQCECKWDELTRKKLFS